MHSVGWNCDGRRLASGSFDKSVAIFSLDRDRLVRPQTRDGFLAPFTDALKCFFLFFFRPRITRIAVTPARWISCVGMPLCPTCWAQPVVTKRYAFGMSEPANARQRLIQRVKISTSLGHRTEILSPLGIKRIWLHSSIRAHTKSVPRSNSISKWTKSRGTIPVIYSFWRTDRAAFTF